MRIFVDFPYNVFWLAAPLLPFITRTVVLVLFRRYASVQLSEEELDRETHRQLSLTLAGFSFSAVAALALLDPIVRKSLEYPTYFVFVSFIAFLASANLDSYKSKRWQDQLGTALRECGMLCLILCLVILVVGSSFSAGMEGFLSGIALFAWTIDHITHLRHKAAYLRAKERDNAPPRQISGRTEAGPGAI